MKNDFERLVEEDKKKYHDKLISMVNPGFHSALVNQVAKAEGDKQKKGDNPEYSVFLAFTKGIYPDKKPYEHEELTERERFLKSCRVL